MELSYDSHEMAQRNLGHFFLHRGIDKTPEIAYNNNTTTPTSLELGESDLKGSNHYNIGLFRSPF